VIKPHAVRSPAMHFDLIDLRLFVNISEQNSLTGGAERSHMSLPAASARIKNLEDSFGTRLLHRTGQGVTLTPPGQALLHHAAGDAAVGTAARRHGGICARRQKPSYGK